MRWAGLDRFSAGGAERNRPSASSKEVLASTWGRPNSAGSCSARFWTYAQPDIFPLSCQ